MVYGPVQLSTGLRNFFDFCLSEMRGETDKELKHAAKLLKSKTNEQLNEDLKYCKGHESVEVDVLRKELSALISVWTRDYSIELLRDIADTGLKTHMRADEIGIGCGFEIEGPDGDGGSGVRKQWKRIENPLDDRVLALVTYSYNDSRDKTEVFDKNQIVLPHYGGPRSEGHVGSRIPTPSEVIEGKKRWADYSASSDKIENRIETHIRSVDGDDATALLIYSAYSSDDRDVPIDNLDEIAIEGKAIICQISDYKSDGFKDYESDIVENPTWLDICVLFNRAIKITGDTHHCFLEGVCKTNKDKDGIPVYEFSTGS